MLESTIKPLLKAILAKIVLYLPWGAREAIFAALISRIGARVVLARMAWQMSITHIGANGHWGLMVSAADDGIVLPRYAHTEDRALYAQALLDDCFAAAVARISISVRILA